MRFRSAYLKLTGIYVLIVMIISIVFSTVLYRVSVIELERGFGRQANKLFLLNKNNYPEKVFNIDQIRAEQLTESKEKLVVNLIYFNLLILVLSAILSYFYAIKTMEPIEEAFEAQDRFTADASHELKTPLAAMKTEIEVGLRDKNLKITDAREILKSNLEEIKKLEVLSGTLLELSRRKNEAKTEFKKIKLDEIIKQAIKKTESLAKKRKIEIIAKLKIINTIGDKESLQELFTILIDNAIKYSFEGGKIIIKFITNNREVLISIKDFGCGIDKKDIPHIFDRFYRVDPSRCKIKNNGFGLGLAIAKQITKLHGGKINVKSDLGKGSEFVVELKKE